MKSAEKEATRPATYRPEPAIFCIKTFMPHPGREIELEARLQEHWDALHDADLTVPGQAPLFLRSNAGRILEIFEWKDQGAMEEAHKNEDLQETWRKILQVATLVPLASLGEASEDYAHFVETKPREHANMPNMVKIVAVKPLPGKLNELISKLKMHDAKLKKMGYTTGRHMHMRGEKEGHVVEIAEWVSLDKVKDAQENQEVQALWHEFDNAVEGNTPLIGLPEAKDRYSLFPAITLHAIEEKMKMQMQA